MGEGRLRESVARTRTTRQGGENARAGGNHSLSLFLAPSSCRSSMHSDSLCMRREICSSATEERVCTRNRATVRDNDGPITGNKRYQSRLFGRASRAFPRDCFFFLRCRAVDFPSQYECQMVRLFFISPSSPLISLSGSSRFSFERNKSGNSRSVYIIGARGKFKWSKKVNIHFSSGSIRLSIFALSMAFLSSAIFFQRYARVNNKYRFDVISSNCIERGRNDRDEGETKGTR